MISYLLSFHRPVCQHQAHINRDCSLGIGNERVDVEFNDFGEILGELPDPQQHINDGDLVNRWLPAHAVQQRVSTDLVQPFLGLLIREGDDEGNVVLDT